MPFTTDTWFTEWIQSEGITSPTEVDLALRDGNVRTRLWDAATDVPYATRSLPASTDTSVLAGAAMDLSGQLDCCLAWECRQRDIDRLFSKVWHYFDRVVIVGPSAYVIRSAHESGNEDWAIAKVKADAQLLFYLRDAGAESMMVFREKPPACVDHITDRAESVGISIFMT